MGQSNVNENRDLLLRNEGLMFFGTINRSVTHELNNVMAIINERSGLMDDLLMAENQGIPMDSEKFKQLSKKIAVQVERGKILIKRLNRFAHSTDELVTSFNLNTLLEDITNLSQRLANLQNLQLEIKLSGESISLISNPFFLQQAVYICFELFMAVPEKNHLITIELEKHETTARVIISGTFLADTEAVLSKRALLDVLLEELKGSVQVITENENRQLIILTIPV